MVKKIIVITAILSFIGITNADPIKNITIDDDGNSVEKWQDGWYGPHEDNEVEPGMQTGQQWDLERFLLNDTKLSMVGGFNFKDGQTAGGYNYKGGDIFIDIKNSENKWDYSIVMDFTKQNSDGTYNYSVYRLDGDETFDNGLISENNNSPFSEPWKLGSGGDLLETGSFTFRTLTGEEIAELGLDPNETHYTVEGFGLAFLNDEGEFELHYTMECGNDVLKGGSSIALPETGTFSLLFIGSICMIGFWALRRRKEE